MSEYDDSFETDSTSTDKEGETLPAHVSVTSDSGDAAGSPHNTSAADKKDTVASSPVPIASAPTSAAVTPASASPVTVVPGIGAVPVPVPVPVPVNVAEKPAVTQSTSEKSDQSSASASSPLPMPRSRGNALTPPVADDALIPDKGAESSSGQSEGEAWRRFTLQSTSKLSTSGSASLPREIAEKAARAGEGAEFQALSKFVAFGSERGSTATTTYTGQTSQLTSELHAQPTPSGVPRLFVAFPASEGDSSSMKEAEEKQRAELTSVRSLSPPPPPPPLAALAAESPQKTPSETKSSASVAPSSIFSTLSQHLQAQTLQQAAAGTEAAATINPTVAATTNAAVTNTLSLPLPLASSLAPKVATASSTVDAGVLVPALTAAAPSLMTASEERGARSPSKANATAAPAATAVVTTATTAPAAPLLSLPTLPPPSWATAGGVTATVPPLQPGLITETVKAADGRVDGNRGRVQHESPLSVKPRQAVAPLPPPPDYHRPPAEESRTSELREASEAVERLVKAFAVLKGYGALEKGNREGIDTAKTSTVSATATTAHRAGAASTVQVRQAGRTRGPRVPAAHVDASVAGSTAQYAARSSASLPGGSSNNYSKEEQESLAEGLVLDCVLGLLQERARYSGKTGVWKEDAPIENDGVGSLWRTVRPHYEVVSADAFTSNGGRGGSIGAGRGRGALASSPFSSSPRDGMRSSAMLDGVPSIDVPFFDPRDRHSATDLYNVVQEALAKYVLRRVRTSEGPVPAAPTTAPLPVAHITAVFAWALLLDMSSVCQEIARCAYDAAAASPSSVYPVLVEFHGDAACAEVARAAMHCLPFEALTTAGSCDGAVSTEPRGCFFRMACWVTQEQLWTVSDALLDTVRDDMVKRAKAVQYASFNAAARLSDVDSRLLVPPQTPMFTMRPLPCRGGGGPSSSSLTRATSSGAAATNRFPENAPSDAAYRKERSAHTAVNASAMERDFFDVPAAVLQKVAYHVSTLSTAILSSRGAGSILADVQADDYADVATAVAETVSELLQDEAIKAAVQRRAAEKVKKAQMAQSTYISATRQRKEQAIIDKAEKEAEEMVQHILQEFRAQGLA